MLEVRGYDRNFRPGFGGPPLLVDMSLSVASIDRVSEVDMDYTLTIFLREYWRDERLHFSETNRSLSLDGRLVERLWVPDTFLVNAKSSFLHKVTVDNRLLRLFPDGRLLYGLRITAKAACPMDLRKYPLDVQTCPLQFESYGYTTEDIRFKWKDGNESIHGLERIELAQFWVGEHEVSDEVQKYETGEYPRLTIRFKLYRNIMYFILQTYLPATLLVVLSWVSFWINHEAVPARVALGITTVLTMTTFITSARDSLPKISYIKAIDVYCVMCFLFVFAALLEYAAVNYHSSVRQRREQKALKAKQAGLEDSRLSLSADPRVRKLSGMGMAVLNAAKLQKEANDRAAATEGGRGRQREQTDVRKRPVSFATLGQKVMKIQEEGRQDRKRLTIAEVVQRVKTSNIKLQVKDVNTIDKYSRVVFPGVFFLFCVMYWVSYAHT
uniref:Gamma-aminobutyric acid receptor subunit pi n=1 Tax=Branchiostoma floridae TaxID=7739 RepID=C3YAJ6_BRAFL|eukprot:XP_002606734.1 hypothetical protein BRAFLDRAFT_226027 [Branchiostoma floridae]